MAVARRPTFPALGYPEVSAIDEYRIRELLGQVKAGRVSRRSFVQTMVGSGLSAPWPPNYWHGSESPRASRRAPGSRRPGGGAEAVTACSGGGVPPSSTRTSPSGSRTPTGRASSMSRSPPLTPTATWCRSWRTRFPVIGTAAWAGMGARSSGSSRRA